MGTHAGRYSRQYGHPALDVWAGGLSYGKGGAPSGLVGVSATPLKQFQSFGFSALSATANGNSKTNFVVLYTSMDQREDRNCGSSIDAPCVVHRYRTAPQGR
ncbi:hypothetical protein FRC18_005476 [Serendipita sp. 400]|nr:hypothetical protein FRC18_005476 [Serendipita sp. 400]